MPSSELDQWQAMALQLGQAAQAQDWQRVQKLDAMLAQWLRAGVPEGLSALVRAELLAQHTAAVQACTQAKQEVHQQLQQLHNQQEAQKAYAWQEVLG